MLIVIKLFPLHSLVHVTLILVIDAINPRNIVSGYWILDILIYANHQLMNFNGFFQLQEKL